MLPFDTADGTRKQKEMTFVSFQIKNVAELMLLSYLQFPRGIFDVELSEALS
jgi:hypothetical protein